MKKNNCDTIAILDSGIGGISILKQLINKNKVGNYIYFADNLYMPYGNKDKEFVKNRVEEIIDYLKKNYHANKIIIACNTASTCLYGIKDKTIEILKFNKSKTFLTTELTKKNLVGYNAISSKNLATDIEKNIFNKHALNRIIKKEIKQNNLDKLSELTLGCTHYELVAEIFKKQCKNTRILLNSSALIDRLNITKNSDLNVTIIMSKRIKKYENKLIKLLNNK